MLKLSYKYCVNSVHYTMSHVIIIQLWKLHYCSRESIIGGIQNHVMLVWYLHNEEKVYHISGL